MNIIWIIVISAAGLYSILVLSYLAGWHRLSGFDRQKMRESHPVSLIIPVRNEERNIRPLLTDIDNQLYPADKIDVIFINDHSEDNTRQEILSGQSNRNIRIIDLPGHENGKKSAIRKGLEESKTDIILMLDADSEIYDRWISDMTGCLIQTGSRLVFGPVRYRGRNPWERIQQLELYSLVGTGAAACGLNSPILCNGTNMICYRKDYLQFYDSNGQNTVSGDDVFFLLWLKKQFPGRITFLKSPDSVIETEPSSGFLPFIQQRLRWISKTRFYKDPHIILSSMTVFLVNFLLLALLIGMTANLQLWKTFVLLFTSKIVTDFVFLFSVTKYYKSQSLLIYFLPIQLVYFIYVIFIAVAGNMLPVSWKGRKHKI